MTGPETDDELTALEVVYGTSAATVEVARNKAHEQLEEDTDGYRKEVFDETVYNGRDVGIAFEMVIRGEPDFGNAETIEEIRMDLSEYGPLPP